METVEHTARIILVAEMLGGAKVLPRVEVDKLLDSRARYGVTSKAGFDPGCPVAAGEGDVCGTPEERYEFTRSELIALVNEAVQASQRNTKQ